MMQRIQTWLREHPIVIAAATLAVLRVLGLPQPAFEGCALVLLCWALGSKPRPLALPSPTVTFVPPGTVVAPLANDWSKPPAPKGAVCPQPSLNVTTTRGIVP